LDEYIVYLIGMNEGFCLARSWM